MIPYKRAIMSFEINLLQAFFQENDFKMSQSSIQCIHFTQMNTRVSS